MESRIAAAVVRFQREQQGRGPEHVTAHLVGSMAVVRCNGIFTPTEAKLATTDVGRELIASARRELRSIHHREIEAVVGELAGSRVLRSYCDVHVAAAEQMEVYVFADNVESTVRISERGRSDGRPKGA